MVLEKDIEDIPVSPQKHRTAFPPNFVHSLDSTHMFLTALGCKNEGITYASVHDSYWTHGCDVDRMGEILRDKFIDLHSKPILKNLRNYWIKKFDPNGTKGLANRLKPIPERGAFNLKNVKESPYFFH